MILLHATCKKKDSIEAPAIVQTDKGFKVKGKDGEAVMQTWTCSKCFDEFRVIVPIPPDLTALNERIKSYLGNGGLFNPELMEHDKVRALILDLQQAIKAKR